MALNTSVGDLLSSRVGVGPELRTSGVSDSSPPVAWRSILPFAVAELGLLIAVANRYGFHRDELYFREAARHPALGYDDQPALTPLLGRLSSAIFGDTPRGIRVFSAIAMALAVVLVPLIARELGGGTRAQLIAAATMAATGGVMAAGHLLSTATFDVLAWLVVLWLVTRQLAGADEREWLLVGLASGIALENKHLILLLLASLAAGFLLAGRGGVVRSGWLWAGAAIAIALWVPNLAWQAAHGWPQLELAGKIADEDPVVNRITLIPFQALIIGPLITPVAVAGLVWLLRNPRYRALGIGFLALLALCIVIGAKQYYPSAFAVALLGAGAIPTERWLARRRWHAPALVAATVVSAAVAIFLVLPVVPVTDVHATPVPAVNEDAIETIGWPRFVDTVAGVWRRLPEAERRTAVIFTGNYGEAGAIDRFGPARGLPNAYSGHNAFARWGIPAGSQGPVIVLGYSYREWLDGEFTGCVESARIDNGVDVDNEEQGGPVWTCRAPARPWRELWPELRHLSP